MLAGTRWGGAVASLDWWRGLGVERSIVWGGGASGVEGAGPPSSPTSMASSMLKEASECASSEGAAASG